MDAERVIGVDVGGTKILAGVLARDGKMEDEKECPTPVESQAELLDAIDSTVEALLPGRADVGALGLGIPSQVDQTAGRAYGSVNIPLHDVALRDRMRERFRLPVALENDGNAAAFAEWAFGAARGTRDMVMLTLGTGVGGGIVIDGRLYRGWAELGHMVIEHDGRPCQGTCTGRGHVESYCTGVAAAEAAREALGVDADAYSLVRLGWEGDATAVRVLRNIGRRVGSAIGGLVNVFNPQVVVIGGGFGAAAGELLLEPARKVVRREALAPADESVRIVPAQLGGDAGVIGAGLIAFEALGS